MPFTPYWLLHEPGKTHGFATVKTSHADTAEEAIEWWRKNDGAEWVADFDAWGTVIEARLITEPFVTA